MVKNLLLRDDVYIGEDHPIFILAEIGQNHQGNMDTAKTLIEAAKESGADCVKFQKTCLTEKFNKAALQRPYTDKNSWGKTYQEHKEYLEFTNEQFIELKNYATSLGILFSASPMDHVSLNFLASMNVPFIKIGSGESNNIHFVEDAAKLDVPLIISTGMQDLENVSLVYNTVSKYHKKFCLLHCVSSYPTPPAEINLKAIKLFKEIFSDVNIGYSGHELGIDISVAAVAMGAKVIERHITLGHNQKGSDHICSLEPSEFKLMVQKIRTLEIALGRPQKNFQDSEIACYKKLKKSIVMGNFASKGHILTKSDCKIKVSEPHGIDPINLDSCVGKVLIKDMQADDPLTLDCLK